MEASEAAAAKKGSTGNSEEGGHAGARVMVETWMLREDPNSN